MYTKKQGNYDIETSCNYAKHANNMPGYTLIAILITGILLFLIGS